MIAVYKKEIRTYFTQMTGYIFLTALVLLLGLFFVMINVYSLNTEYYAVLSGTTILFFILIPTLTMRLFAEEKRQKTDQLLFTTRLSVFQIVFGKFLAGTTLFVFGI